MERKPLNVKIPENIHNELESRGENKTKATTKALELYLWGEEDNSEVEHLKEMLETHQQHHESQLAEKDERIAELTKSLATFESIITDMKETNARQFDALKEAKDNQMQMVNELVQRMQENMSASLASMVGEYKSREQLLIESAQTVNAEVVEQVVEKTMEKMPVQAEEKKGFLSKLFG